MNLLSVDADHERTENIHRLVAALVMVMTGCAGVFITVGGVIPSDGRLKCTNSEIVWIRIENAGSTHGSANCLRNISVVHVTRLICQNSVFYNHPCAFLKNVVHTGDC